MHVPVDGEHVTARPFRAAPVDWLRAACAALLVGLSACGGGGDALAPDPAPGPAATPPAPALRRAGTALAIDAGASGRPVDLRLVSSANGDGVAVWQADDGTRHNLWANRYRAAAAAWESAAPLETSDAHIDDFDLAVDANGNAVVVWREISVGQPSANGVLMSARLDADADAWTAPELLSDAGREPRVASSAAGSVLAVYVGPNQHIVRGRFFDRATGTWQPEEVVEENSTGTGFSAGPTALLDASGNALAAFLSLRSAAGGVASNYFAVDGGGWARLPPGEPGLLGGVPGSFSAEGPIGNLQLATSIDGNFALAWEAGENWDVPELSMIRVARFTSRTRSWSNAQTLVPADAQKNVRLQRLGSDAAGNAFLVWTENRGQRTALIALRLDHEGDVCTAVQVIDSAVGGGAAQADLGVDPGGDALVIWQQFEGGRADDGSRSNIAINRFDSESGAWASAVLAETQAGNASSPHASAQAGRALLGWIQPDDAGNARVYALLQPLADD